MIGIALAYSPPHWPWVGKHIDARPRGQRRWRSASTLHWPGALAERLAGTQGLLMIAVLIGVCAAVQRGGRVAHGPARAAQLCARAVAQPADHRHRLGPGGQSAGLSDPRMGMVPTVSRISARRWRWA